MFNYLSSRDSRLIMNLDLREPQVYEESIKIGRDEPLLVEDMLLHKKDGRSLLIKVQFSELNGRNVPRDLKNASPDFNHRIILLFADENEMKKHYKSRGLVGDLDWSNMSYESFKSEFSDMQKIAGDLQSNDGFDLVYFDVGGNCVIENPTDK